jgi:hypothetical protein
MQTGKKYYQIISNCSYLLEKIAEIYSKANIKYEFISLESNSYLNDEKALRFSSHSKIERLQNILKIKHLLSDAINLEFIGYDIHDYNNW